MSHEKLNGSATERLTNKQIWQRIGWIKDRIHPFSWGLQIPYGGIRQMNPAAILSQYLNWELPFYRQLSQKLVRLHEAGYETVYFTGRNGKTLLMVDIDNHKPGSGTYEGAVSLAMELNRCLPVECHFERSTNGNGVHLYLLLDAKEWKSLMHYNHFVKKHLQQALNQFAQTFDVEMVEVKGTIPYQEGKGAKLKLNMGQLAKMPRCLDRERFGDEITREQLERFVIRLMKNHQPAQPKKKCGSTVKGLVKRYERYKAVASRLISEKIWIRTDKIFDAEHAACYLLALSCVDKGATEVPGAQIKGLMRWLYQQGICKHSYDGQRWKYFRQLLFKKQLLQAINLEYAPRQCMQWSLAPDLQTILDIKTERDICDEVIARIQELPDNQVPKPIDCWRINLYDWRNYDHSRWEQYFGSLAA